MAVLSEIDPLTAVVVHRPGPEVERMTPARAQELLYNDIIPVEEVQKEHDGLARVLSGYAEVREIRDLVAEALDSLKVRNEAVGRLYEPGTLEHRILADIWHDRDGAGAARDLVEGLPMPQTRLKTAIEGPVFLLPPLPNLYFTRDIGFVIGGTAFLSNMAYGVRKNEAVACFLAFRRLGMPGTPVGECKIEGGDVLVVSRSLIVVGVGERTAAGAIDSLVELLLADGRKPITVLAVELPGTRATIHLDMIATLVDEHTLLGFESLLDGPRACRTFRIDGRPGADWNIREESCLLKALKNCGYPVDLIACGGGSGERRERQEREQWFSACNSFALAPGRIIVYDTNRGTLEELSQAGFDICEDFGQDGSPVEKRDPGRVAYAVRGVELARGGGGPRCMTLPVDRMNSGE